MSASDKVMAQLCDGYASAVFDKDVESFMRLYDPDVRVFDAWGVWEYAGAAAWQVAVEGWLTSLGHERVRVSFDDVRSWSGESVTSVSAIASYASLSPEGVELRAMQNRVTWVIRTDGNVPRIVHEHTSAPIGFEDMKAILIRESGT